MTDGTAETVVRAARTVFARHGVRRTSMADVAREARVARQTLYTVAPNRAGLIEMALIDCCRELRDRLDADLADAADDVREALVDVLGHAVELARDSHEFGELAEALPPERVEVIIGATTATEALLGQSLEPILRRGAEAGLLREGVELPTATRWLLGAISFALLREHADGEALRAELRQFAVPSVFRDQA